jgi:MoxR-like ATPase
LRWNDRPIFDASARSALLKTLAWRRSTPSRPACRPWATWPRGQIATAVYLAHHLRKPVLIEGPAGVGKTDLAVSAARMLNFELLRLQCYEGLDDSKALYEWKYGKQLLYTQILKEKIGLLIDGADTLQAAFGKLARASRTCSSRATSCSRARCCRRWSRTAAACC